MTDKISGLASDIFDGLLLKKGYKNVRIVKHKDTRECFMEVLDGNDQYYKITFKTMSLQEYRAQTRECLEIGDT